MHTLWNVYERVQVRRDPGGIEASFRIGKRGNDAEIDHQWQRDPGSRGANCA